MGKRIEVPTAQGLMGAYLAEPGGVPRGAVVVLQEIFGVNADMRDTCDWLAGDGFTAVCPDLFWRLQAGVELTDRSDQEWKQGFALYSAFDREAGVDDAAAAITAVRKLIDPFARVAVMGFCLGGLMTFRTAALRNADAAVAYYGGGIELYLAEAEGLTSPMMLHLAGDDEYMPPEAQRSIRAALEGLGHVEIHGYPGCSHAFARRGGAHHDAAAAALANRRTLRFLHQNLG